MRKTLVINNDWTFVREDCGAENATTAIGEAVNLPYTWNGIDGQDGGGDYLRTAFWFVKKFAKPALTDDERVYIEFKGVNSSAQVWFNGNKVAEHDGGYSTFRADLTNYLSDENTLCVRVDNSKNEKVYPQTADFTFYGGIYRDVNLIIVNKNHFDLDYYGAPGIQVIPTINGTDGEVVTKTYVTGEGDVKITIFDADGNIVASGKNDEKLVIKNAHLWNGIADPYLYTVQAELIFNDCVVDCVKTRIGLRTFAFDPKDGFILNGKKYPLRGVSRHQDRPKIGNALTKANHEEDIRLIKEIGANTIRLAHYQHDDYFYDLCDENGFVVWAEIPYISRQMPQANDNAVSQMKELIYQQYNHPCIVMWGISNEITMYHKHKKNMLEFHHKLNNLVKELDPTRTTTLACYASCGFFNKAAHITDVVGWNLYLGWYTPFLWLNDVWLSFFHLFYKNRCLGYSEYGAEAMPNLHSKHPRRGDNSEEYQTIYHEYMLRFFDRHPYIWGTYVWNMFDFAADARNQGGEPGMNHKGLVTFDRQTKKDSFYLYKAYWAKEKFIHIAGKRFANRTGKTTVIKVYTNAGAPALTQNGKKIDGKTKDGKVFEFKIKLETENIIRAENGNLTDECVIKKVNKPDPDYKLHVKSETQSWQK